MNFEQTLRDMSSYQEDDDDGTHDVILTVDVGGGNTEKHRGRISVDDDTVSLWPTQYYVPGYGEKSKAVRWPDFKVPTNGESFHGEVPLHIRLSHIVVVEWAVNDYS